MSLFVVETLQERSNGNLELVKVYSGVLVLIQALEKKAQVLLSWVHILLLDELTEVVDVKVTLLLAVQSLEGVLGRNLQLVDNALADMLNRNFTLTELSEEGFHRLSRLWLEVVTCVVFAAIETTTSINQSFVFLLTRQESLVHFFRRPEAVRVFINLVENNKDFVDGNLDFEVLLQSVEHIITVNLLHIGILQTQEHLVGVAHVEIWLQCQFSSALLKVALHRANVVQSICELFGARKSVWRGRVSVILRELLGSVNVAV